MRFGLTDGQPKTLDEIGKVYGVTRERIRQIESKTMSKLRHPSRSQVLRDYLDLPSATPPAPRSFATTSTYRRPPLPLPGPSRLPRLTVGPARIFRRSLGCVEVRVVSVGNP
jgi:hypothetical protein